jgi:hypothetical protein
MVVEVTKMIKADDLLASQYLNQTVYGISGYVLGVLEEIRTSSTGEQEFWVRNSYGLIQISFFYIE